MFLEVISNKLSLSPKKLLETLKKENKNKKWTFSPISLNIKDNTITTNAKEIKELALRAREWAEQAEGIGDVDDRAGTIRLLHEWFKGTRIELTRPFDAIKTELISNEKILEQTIAALKTKKETLLENAYKEREQNMREHIQSELDALEEKENIAIPISMLEHFINKKRKTDILTGKGQLKKSVIDSFTLELNQLLEPIRSEKIENQKMIDNLKQLALDIPDASLEQLNKLHKEVKQRYPHAEEQAQQQLEVLIQQKEQQKEEREDTEKELRYLYQAEEISKKASETEESLSHCLAAIRETREKVLTVKIRAKIDRIGIDVKKRLEILTAHNQVNRPNLYSVNIEDVKVLSTAKVVAHTDKEAKEKLLNLFSNMLSLTELKKEIKND